MTLDQFKNQYFCTIEIRNHDNSKLEILSKAIRRSDTRIVDSVRTLIDIPQTNNWLSDSQSAISVTPWNWEKLINYTKCAHLDTFAQRAPIDDFYPLNQIGYPDIDHLYEK